MTKNHRPGRVESKENTQDQCVRIKAFWASSRRRGEAGSPGLWKPWHSAQSAPAATGVSALVLPWQVAHSAILGSITLDESLEFSALWQDLQVSAPAASFLCSGTLWLKSPQGR